jgi:hypothetical protein
LRKEISGNGCGNHFDSAMAQNHASGCELRLKYMHGIATVLLGPVHGAVGIAG